MSLLPLAVYDQQADSDDAKYAGANSDTSNGWAGKGAAVGILVQRGWVDNDDRLACEYGAVYTDRRTFLRCLSAACFECDKVWPAMLA